MVYFDIAIPTRRTFKDTKQDLEECQRLIQKLNGAAPIYRTIYNFTGTPHWSNAIIDRIFFDFDVDKKKPETELIEARRFHEFLLEKKLSHSIFFSGRGFHIFVKTKTVHSNELENPRGAVKRAHTIIAEEAGISPDPTTKDILRISRVPNTLNIRSKLFCIPLVHEQIYLKKYQIEKLARRQRMISPVYYGEELLDLREYDGPEFTIDTPVQEERIGVFDEVIEKELPTCVKNLLIQGDCNFEERYLIIIALRELIYSKDEIKEILERYLTPEKFYHCIYEEEQLDYLFSRGDLFFPSCQKIREDGYCVQNCQGNKIYLEV